MAATGPCASVLQPAGWLHRSKVRPQPHCTSGWPAMTACRLASSLGLSCPKQLLITWGRRRQRVSHLHFTECVKSICAAVPPSQLWSTRERGQVGHRHEDGNPACSTPQAAVRTDAHTLTLCPCNPGTAWCSRTPLSRRDGTRRAGAHLRRQAGLDLLQQRDHAHGVSRVHQRAAARQHGAQHGHDARQVAVVLAQHPARAAPHMCPTTHTTSPPGPGSCQRCSAAAPRAAPAPQSHMISPDTPARRAWLPSSSGPTIAGPAHCAGPPRAPRMPPTLP